MPHLRLDFTAVKPESARYQRANRQNTQAAAAAERGKANKYGRRPGATGVTGLSMELSGRFGPNLDTLLRKLAGFARAGASTTGSDNTRHLQQWRMALSVALARFTHAAICSAAESDPESKTGIFVNNQVGADYVAVDDIRIQVGTDYVAVDDMRNHVGGGYTAVAPPHQLAATSRDAGTTGVVR